jgi:hypothetical protein
MRAAMCTEAGAVSPQGHGERRRCRDRVTVRESALGQSTVNVFWAIGLGFHFDSLFSVSAGLLGWNFISFYFSLPFPFSFPFTC